MTEDEVLLKIALNRAGMTIQEMMDVLWDRGYRPTGYEHRHRYVQMNGEFYCKDCGDKK